MFIILKSILMLIEPCMVLVLSTTSIDNSSKKLYTCRFFIITRKEIFLPLVFETGARILLVNWILQHCTIIAVELPRHTPYYKTRMLLIYKNHITDSSVLTVICSGMYCCRIPQVSDLNREIARKKKKKKHHPSESHWILQNIQEVKRGTYKIYISLK